MPQHHRSRMSGVLGRAAVVVSMLGVLAVAGAPAASAHAALEETTPADGRTMKSAPDQVLLRFNESMLDFGFTVRVEGPDGSITKGKATVRGRTVVQNLDADLPNGSYSLQWRAVSGDGHPISGKSRFKIAVEQPATARPSTQVTPTPGTPSATAPTPVAETIEAENTSSDSSDGASNTPVLVGLGAVATLLIAAGTFLAIRRRPR